MWLKKRLKKNLHDKKRWRGVRSLDARILLADFLDCQKNPLTAWVFFEGILVAIGAAQIVSKMPGRVRSKAARMPARRGQECRPVPRGGMLPLLCLACRSRFAFAERSCTVPGAKAV